MDNKTMYAEFCKKINVPIYSKNWWMDAVCGEENWDVWLYGEGHDILAAMPYYYENRGEYRYITRAPLTQNNGILFNYPSNMKLSSKAKFEEKIINSACEYIESLGVDVYEQQYRYQFDNWMPFYWNKYTAITRYTYVIDTSVGLDQIWENITSNYKKNIKKGMKNCTVCDDLASDIFYREHEKVFLKQGLKCPFSFEKWQRIYNAVRANNSGKILYAKDENDNILSLLFLVWDAEQAYLLLGGSMPPYSGTESYSVLIWEGIKFAQQNHLNFDFEGSVIKQISKSYRQFGGVPKPYFRIRKIFNPEIIRKEAEEQIMNL